MTSVSITTTTHQLVLTPPDQPEIVLQVPAPVTVELAAQGTQGPPGTAPITWAHYKDHWSAIPVPAGPTAGGSVLAYTLDGVTRYRFIAAPYDPALDAFYTTFEAGALSGLIAKRG